jgi:hypothetical protein
VSDSVSAPPSLSGGGYSYNAAAVPTFANFSQGGGFGAQGGVAQQNGQQSVGYDGGQMQSHAYGAGPMQSHAYAGYNQQPVQQQWQGEMQQTQPVYQQNVAPVQHQQWMAQQQPTQPTYSTPGIEPSIDPSVLNPPADVQSFSHEAVPSMATPSPPKEQSKPVMATDAAANMFGTPHADTPKKSVKMEGESLPSLPMDSNAQELFAAPPVDSSTPSKSEVAADVFSSPPSLTQPSDAVGEQFNQPPSFEPNADNTANPSNEDVPTDAGSFFGSPSQSENNTNNLTEQPNATSFFGSEKDSGEQTLEKSQPDESEVTAMQPPPINATPAPVKSFGGLPPPPVIGAIKPLSTPTSYVASPAVGSSLPPPPMARSSPTALKEEDMSAEMADVSLS